LGGKFHETGYLTALNELSVAFIFVAISSASLIKPGKAVFDRIEEVGAQIAESIGGINVLDGFPRIADESLRKIHQLREDLSPEERMLFQSSLFEALSRSKIPPREPEQTN